jgi:hypothetical protein
MASSQQTNATARAVTYPALDRRNRTAFLHASTLFSHPCVNDQELQQRNDDFLGMAHFNGADVDRTDVTMLALRSHQRRGGSNTCDDCKLVALAQLVAHHHSSNKAADKKLTATPTKKAARKLSMMLLLQVD